MRVAKRIKLAVAAGLLVALVGAKLVRGNGGPFVVKYPGGDPAAKGVLARLDPSLRPARETKLRVVKEDLGISFTQEAFRRPADTMPLVTVSAAYTIENPTNEEVQVDFGFPILRGIYISPLSMTPLPDVQVTVDGKYLKADVISNSAIYGIIRQQAGVQSKRALPPMATWQNASP